MRLTNGASEGTQKYMLDGIRYICENFKDRGPGTHSERKAQKFLKKELEQWADEVETEDFYVHPAAFMGWIPPAGIICLISVLFYWITYKSANHSVALPIIACLLTFFALLCLIIEFLMYREFVDFLFPRKISRNVMARRKPTGEVKRRIVFAGHTDAANEWTYSLHGGLKSLAPVMGGSIGGLIGLSIFNVIWVIYAIASGEYTSGIWMVLGIIQLILVPFFIAILFFINWRVIVDGANDNLTADYIAMGVLKEMAENDKRYENTEVCCFLAGSEEAGIRGSVDYAKRHQEELKDVETIIIAMDTMREIEQLQIYTQGCTGTQKNSNAVGELLYKAGENCGIEMKETDIYPGAVDAEGFSRYGIEAVGFCGVNHDPKTYYHTRLDTPDNMSPECINLSLDICLEAAELYDRKGGIDAFREEGRQRFKKGYNK